MEYDDLTAIGGPADASADLRIGVTHAPYLRVLDQFARDGYDITMAGHTHGGQLCLPIKERWSPTVTSIGLESAACIAIQPTQWPAIPKCVAACVCRSRHFPICSGALLLPTRSRAGDPDPQGRVSSQTSRVPTARTPTCSDRLTTLSALLRAAGCGAVW
ncbi:MAG: hypothetical protein R2709_01415 [Marmoricola sp.]